VRVTDPGATVDWHGTRDDQLGQKPDLFWPRVRRSTARVKLIACDAVNVDDLYVQNTAADYGDQCEVTLHNATDAAARRDVVLSVLDPGKNPAALPAMSCGSGRRM